MFALLTHIRELIIGVDWHIINIDVKLPGSLKQIFRKKSNCTPVMFEKAKMSLNYQRQLFIIHLFVL